MALAKIKTDFSNRGCLPNLAKYYLVVMNILLLLGGAFAGGLGIYLLLECLMRSNTAFSGTAAACIVGGAVVVMRSILALCAVYKEKLSFFKIYLWVLVICVFLRFIATAMHYASAHDSHTTASAEWKHQFDLYGKDQTATEIVDMAQKKLSCCGYDGPETIVFSNGSYPRSCCLQPVEECKTPFTHKCSATFNGMTFSATTVYYATGLAVIVAEILAVLATSYLISFLKKSENQQIGMEYRVF